MPLVEFCGQSSRDPDNNQANTARLINCYREPIGGRSNYVIKSVLGTVGFATIPGVFTRAMKEVRGIVYFVHAGRLARLSPTGAIIDLGAVDDDESVFIDSHDGQVTIAANGRYYLFDGTTLSTPSGAAFSLVNDVLFMNQRTVIIERDGRRVAWSDVGNPASFQGDSVATAEQEDDRNLRAFQVGGSLWIFKERSIERFRNVATGFSYIPGSKIERGLLSKNLAVEMPDGVFFVGDDRLPYIAGGGGISPPLTGQNRAVETAISAGSPTHCLYHEDEGAKHLVIRFSDRPAWVLNMSTGEWHERADQEDGAWSVIAATRAFGDTLVATQDGKFLRLARVDSDVTAPLVRTMISKTLYVNEGNGFRVPLFEVRGRMGRSFLGRATSQVLATTGLVLTDAAGAALAVRTNAQAIRPARLTISVSRDYGETWSNPRTYSMGDLGEYDTRVRTRKWGHFDAAAVFRVRISDPANLPLDASAVVQVA